jgi:hypothetical protein
MTMGRNREKNQHLPPHMRRVGASYYYDTGSAGRALHGKRTWIPLGNNYGLALAEWAKLEG